MRRFLIVIVVVLLAIVIVAIWKQKAVAPEVKQAATSYVTQQECEETTGKTCAFVMCDFIPEGQTFEETCGIGFVPGWQATSD